MVKAKLHEGRVQNIYCYECKLLCAGQNCNLYNDDHFQETFGDCL